MSKGPTLNRTPEPAKKPDVKLEAHGPQKPSTPVIVAPPQAPGDQKPAAGDQKGTPAKKTKEPSKTVLKWRELNKTGFKPEQVIHLLKTGEQKRGGAKRRYALYQEGMTVAAYQEASVKNAGHTAKGAMSDMCWDVAANLIEIK